MGRSLSYSLAQSSTKQEIWAGNVRIYACGDHEVVDTGSRVREDRNPRHLWRGNFNFNFKTSNANMKSLLNLLKNIFIGNDYDPEEDKALYLVKEQYPEKAKLIMERLAKLGLNAENNDLYRELSRFEDYLVTDINKALSVVQDIDINLAYDEWEAKKNKTANVVLTKEERETMYLYKCGIIEIQTGKHEADYWFDVSDQSLIHFKLDGKTYSTSYKSIIMPGTPVRLFNLEQAIDHIAKYFPAHDEYTKAENWDMVAQLMELDFPITEGQLNAITGG